jgi:PPOX class probable F420-dependent enzyme
MTDSALLDLIASHQAGVLSTIKSDGRPQLSNVNYHYYPAAAGSGLIKVSITADRAKYHNLQRDPRASLHVSTSDFWSYAVAEADAEFSAVAADPHDDAVEELIQLFRDVQGEHSDGEDYRRAMVADQRVVLRLPISRVYGTSQG